MTTVMYCDVKFFTGSKMSLDLKCCERYSCCGNCKAVLKAVTILHFPPSSSTSSSSHLSRVGGGTDTYPGTDTTSSSLPPLRASQSVFSSLHCFLLNTGALPQSFPSRYCDFILCHSCSNAHTVSGTFEVGCLSNIHARVLWSRIGRLVTVGTL